MNNECFVNFQHSGLAVSPERPYICCLKSVVLRKRIMKK
jgi:hypothetical protein